LVDDGFLLKVTEILKSERQTTGQEILSIFTIHSQFSLLRKDEKRLELVLDFQFYLQKTLEDLSDAFHSDDELN